MMKKKGKEKIDYSKEKGDYRIPELPTDLKSLADGATSVKVPEKSKRPAKIYNPLTSLREKFTHLKRVSPTVANRALEPNSTDKDSAEPDRAGAHADIQEQAPKKGIQKKDVIKASGKTKVLSDDINTLSERLSELEEHVIDLHAAYDEFVLKSDKFMDYGQFIEVRREVEEKIRLLDKIEKSLEDSRNQILRDSEYMDSIIAGFKYTKKRIEDIEKRMDSISKTEGHDSNGSILKKFRNAFEPQNLKQKVDSLKLSGLDTNVSELKKQVDALKLCENGIQKEIEKLKERQVQDKSRDLPESIKSLNNEIGGIKEKMSDYADSRKLAGIEKQISELAAKVDVSEKRYLESAKDKDAEKAETAEEMRAAMSELKKEMASRVDALCEAKGGRSGSDEVAGLLKKQAELENKIARLERDIEPIHAIQTSVGQINMAIDSIKKDIRKEADAKPAESIGSSLQDDDYAEVKENIEKLKAMLKDL